MAHAAITTALHIDVGKIHFGHGSSHGFCEGDDGNDTVSSGLPGTSMMAPFGSIRTHPIDSPARRAAFIARVRSLAVKLAVRRGMTTSLPYKPREARPGPGIQGAAGHQACLVCCMGCMAVLSIFNFALR